MAAGRQEAAWNQTAELVAAVHNSNPYRSKSYTAAEFNPYARGHAAVPQKIPMVSDATAMRIFEYAWGMKPAPKPEVK